MYGCESWTIKKAKHWNIDAFKLCCWRRFLWVPWTARRSNQSILKEINSEYSLEGLMLKLQYFGHLMWRANSPEKNLMLGKIEGRRRRGQRRMSWLDSITDTMDMNLSKPWEIMKDSESWHAAVCEVTKSGTELSNWTTKITVFFICLLGYIRLTDLGSHLEPLFWKHRVLATGSPGKFPPPTSIALVFLVSDSLLQCLHLFEIFWRASLGIKDSSCWGH